MASPMEENEGRTRESPLSPTKVTTPEIPYSQLLVGDEEEEILNWAEKLNPSPTTPDKVQQLKKEILEHGKEMKDIILTNDKSQPPPGSTKQFPETTNCPNSTSYP